MWGGGTPTHGAFGDDTIPAEMLPRPRRIDEEAIGYKLYRLFTCNLLCVGNVARGAGGVSPFCI